MAKYKHSDRKKIQVGLNNVVIKLVAQGKSAGVNKVKSTIISDILHDNIFEDALTAVF